MSDQAEAPVPEALFAGTLRALAEMEEPSAPQFSLETLDIFDDLLGRVSISAAQPDFDEAARRIGNARRELTTAIAAASRTAGSRPETPNV